MVTRKKFGDEAQVRLLNRSKRATCGVFEREITVHSRDVLKMKMSLKSQGFTIVGTSEAGHNTRKIWFVPGGSSF